MHEHRSKLTPTELALEAVIGRALLADRRRNIGDEQLGVFGVRFSAALSLAEPDWMRVEVPRPAEVGRCQMSILIGDDEWSRRDPAASASLRGLGTVSALSITTTACTTR
jgi:hypothetical protein